MQIPCFMLSWIVIPSWWILSNHLDFSNCNFVTKLPNPGSPKLHIIKLNCFLRENFYLENYFIGSLFSQKYEIIKSNPTRPDQKFLSCCDEIMLRDEITGLDGIVLLLMLSWVPQSAFYSFIVPQPQNIFHPLLVPQQTKIQKTRVVMGSSRLHLIPSLSHSRLKYKY